ncbi:MAG: hypothetical protein EHM28_01580 [Spirochaetaceae bacterium]|nr:MAG: hypothetical protein EHM28_01580 [Spirochaetaceae bacterium]
MKNRNGFRAQTLSGAMLLGLLLLLTVALVLSCNREPDPPTAIETQTPSPTPAPMEIARVRATTFYLEKDAPICKYHPWKAFDQDLTTTWMQDGDGNGTGQIITIDFATPVKADMIRIIPY